MHRARIAGAFGRQTPPTLLRVGRWEFAVALCVLAITGCSGTASRDVPRAGTDVTSNAELAAGASAGAVSPHASKAGATLRILIPRESLHGRLPRYISAATKSLAAAFTRGSGASGQTTTFAFDLTPEANPNCTASKSGTICNVEFDLADGSYTASFSTYDGLLGPNHRPTGNVLSANIAFAVTIEPSVTLPVTLYGVPVTLQMTPQSGGLLGGSARAGFILPVNAPVQQLTVTGFDADGNAIVGAGAPVPRLTTGDPYLKVSPPAGSAPNAFGLQVIGSPAVGHVASLSAAVTPGPASGAGPVASSATLTFIQGVPSVTIEQYPVPTASSFPGGITAGPDGALWFTEQNANKIGRITTSGSFTEYRLPSANSDPFGITAGPDGALWFSGGGSIGRITTGGSVSAFAIPTSHGYLEEIAVGPDRALWFTDATGIGRITTAGSFNAYQIPTSNSFPTGITAGPDGALWFVEDFGNNIGRITTTGSITEYPIPTANSMPGDITAGPDGALWFTDRNNIGRITTGGSITEYPIPAANSYPIGIAAGPDGALWFTESEVNMIGRISTAGNITQYPIPRANSQPQYVTVGPDGAMWFTGLTNYIGRAVLH